MSAFARRALAASALALLGVAGLAGPAAAHAIVAVTSPGTDQELANNDLTINGQVSFGGHTLGDTAADGKVTLKLALAGRPDFTSTVAPTASGAVSFQIPPEKLTYNGKYDIVLTAPWKHSVLAGSDAGAATGSGSFLLAVAPARPIDVKTAVDVASRNVSVTWTRNTEPDLIRYEVKRAKGTSNDFSLLGKVKAGTTTFADATTSDVGGDYRYLVVAVRNGIPGRTEIASDPSLLSADSTAKVPDPPPPPTTAAPPGAAGTGTGTGIGTGIGTGSTLPAGSPGALATSGSVDLSGFNAVRAQTKPVTPGTVALPDPGFQSTLPFAPGEVPESTDVEEGGDIGELAADAPQYRELGATAESDDKARTMAFFAAGLLSTVLLMHVLWVKSEVRRDPLETLVPEGPSSAASTRARRKQQGPSPTLEDTDAADFSPVVVAANANDKIKANRRGARSGTGNGRQKVSTGA